jgi:aldehyde dehydrogenase (NAD+)
MLSFTGSPEVGVLVQQAAARNHIPVVLELGGKSPQIVFADADLKRAADTIILAIVQNAGQTCSAGSRALIEESVYPRFMDMLGERFRAIKTGPHELDLDCGPLISADQKSRVERFLAQAKTDRIATAGAGSLDPRSPKGGYYVTPTLLDRVPPEHMLAQDEVFGPVLAAISFRDEDDAIRIANGTKFGLVAGVWTENGGRQMRMAKAIRAGQVFVNGYGAGGGVELPFGGFKHSGHGREKGMESLKEFTVAKTVIINHQKPAN